jgi:hypothetical protein
MVAYALCRLEAIRGHHSALIYGIGASGRIYTIYPANFTPTQLIHDVAPLLSH